MRREQILHRWRKARPIIAPSMLKCDFGDLAREIALLHSAGVELLHWDVMDGHFVPNLSYGAMVIERIRSRTDLPFEAHLMISEPQRYLDSFLEAGCQCVTIHVEAAEAPDEVLKRIRRADAVAGLALNPETPAATIRPLLPHCDVVLVMSVHPGFGGQKFLASTLDKLRQLRRWIPSETLLSVDGGLDAETIRQAARSGADMYVVGSAIFESEDYRETVAELVELAQNNQLSSSLES